MADHPQGRSTFFTRLLATALIAVLPLLALQIHELVRQKRLDEAAVVAQLQARVERSSVGFEAAIARIENLVQFVATRPELQQLDRERCGALVRGLAQIDPLLANVGAVDLEGRLLCLAQQPSAPQASYADAPWFADALRGTAAGATHLGRPYVGDVTRKWLVNLVRPLHDPGGRRVGMIAAAIDLQKVAERLLSPSGLPQGSVMALIDADGRFLAREPDLAGFAGKPLPPALLEAASAAAGRPFSGVAANRVHGIFITSAALRFGVRVGAGSPLAEVVAKGEQDFRRSLVVALGALALGALAAAFGARRLAAPLRSLAASARAQAAGDNDARADETLPGEFHTLAREFNAMLDARKAGEASQRAQAAAEAASEAKSEFLAHMSHEIRTPMNAIVGLTELTLRTPLTPQQAGYLGKARQAADTLLALIDRILDFSKIESGKLELDRSPFLLDEVLDRVTVIVGHRAQEKGLEFLIGVAREVPQQLLGDGQRLTQVLVNLCGNAVKFTERGEVVLMVSCSAADASQATLRFSVRDTGIGISAEHQARLFQPFTQADASTARRFGGSGLGLVISRQLVELMGGHLALRSEPGHGSEFIFDARFGRATGALPAAAAGAPTGAVAGLHVLVVDDSATARELLVDQLQALGCSAEALPSADAALQRLDDTTRPTPDLVLLDWRMPEVDGLEAARRIQARPAPAPKLVLVTAYGDDAIAQRAREQGLDACLAKPVSASTLLDTIQRVLGRAPVAAPRAGAAEPADDPAVLATLRGRRALLVEDNDFNQLVAADLLRGVAGMQVDIADSGAEGLRRLEDGAYDIVLMDVQMPGMDGYETTRRLRAMPAHARLPVVAMTAHASPHDRALCLAAGMDDVVTKPIDPGTLFAALARRLGPPAAPLPDPGPAAPAGVSIAQGLRRCMGRAELYRRVVQRYLQQWAQQREALRTAAAAGDARALAETAHVLIAGAGTVGADALAALARQLQDQAAAGEPAHWPALLEAMEREGAAAEATLTAYLANDASAAAAG